MAFLTIRPFYLVQELHTLWDPSVGGRCSNVHITVYINLHRHKNLTTQQKKNTLNISNKGKRSETENSAGDSTYLPSHYNNPPHLFFLYFNYYSRLVREQWGRKIVNRRMWTIYSHLENICFCDMFWFAMSVRRENSDRYRMAHSAWRGMQDMFQTLWNVAAIIDRNKSVLSPS